MTINEISECLFIDLKSVHAMFALAAKTNPKIKEKCGKSTKMKVVDWTFDEALLAFEASRKKNCTRRAVTKMEEQFLRENWYARESGYHEKQLFKVPKIMQDLAFYYKRYKGHRPKKCCSTCVYLFAKKYNLAGAGYFPYCNMYEKFAYKFKADIYYDYCEFYEASTRAPLMFIRLKRGGQFMIDEYFNTSTKILDIKPSEFIEQRKSSKDPIVLLHDDFYVEQQEDD